MPDLTPSPLTVVAGVLSGRIIYGLIPDRVKYASWLDLWRWIRQSIGRATG